MITVTITGPQGSGKSTLAEKIKNIVQGEGKIVHVSDEGDISTPAGLRAARVDVLIVTKI